MLDIQYVRENFGKVEKNLEKRRNPEYIKMLKDVKKFDDSWRKCKAEVDDLRSRRNKV
ncbi:serine--tRNA ligase, partial [Candidatus Woesearchaeota archaeon]|nr:serine--tRNA ligase [Candidatus Woesearchaeota archaeon]